MSELLVIESVVERAARRRRWERAWRGFWKGLLGGAIFWLVVLLLYKFLPIPVEALPVAAGISGAMAVIGFAIGWFRRLTLQETARWLDQQQKLKERLSTALEVAKDGKSDHWRTLLITDAASHAREIDTRKLLPISLPAASRWALIVLLVTASLGFVPEYRSKAYVQKKQDAEQIKETGRKLAELTRRNLQQRPPAQPATQKAMDSVEEVAERLQARPMTKAEAIQNIANVADKLKEQTKELGQNPVFKRMEQAARKSDGETLSAMTRADLQKKIEDLEKAAGNQTDTAKLDKFKRELEKLQQAASDMDKNGSTGEARDQLAQSMANMAKQAEALGLSLPQLDEAIEALMGAKIGQVMKDLDLAMMDLEKMQQMAQAMQALKAQMEKIGKDLAEQLDKGQANAAKETLEKMADQLQKSGLSKEQMAKMVEEVAKSIQPAKDYGDVAEDLKKAVAQMRQGDKQQAAQALNDAAKQLDKLMGEAQDMDAMLAALEQLKNAQVCIGNGECLFGMCRGDGPPRAGQGAKGGKGVGTWADDPWASAPEITDLWDNSGIDRPDQDARGHSERDANAPETVSTKIKGQMSPGAQMPSITLKGVHVKGEAKVKYEEAVATAQSEAQSALSQEKVPRAYQNAVRDYFDDMKK